MQTTTATCQAKDPATCKFHGHPEYKQQLLAKNALLQDVRAAQRKTVKKKPVSMPAVTPVALRDELLALNTSDEPFMTDTRLAVHDGGEDRLTFTLNGLDGKRYDFQLQPQAGWLLGYKSYDQDDEDEDLVLRGAQPSVMLRAADWERDLCLRAPGEAGYEAEVLALSIAGMMDRLGSGTHNWNTDQHAVSFTYFGEAYDDINRGLRTGQPPEAEFVATLDAIATEHVLTEPVTVYRGIRCRDAAGCDAVINAGHDLGYMSTSTNPETARGFAGGGNHHGVVMRLELPAGTRCHDARDAQEQEILLPRMFDLSAATWEILAPATV